VAERGLRSLRGRITAGATAVVAVVLVAGAAVFYGVLATSVRETTERAAYARAEQLATRVDDLGLEELAELEDDIAQVVDDDGRIVEASEDADEGPIDRRDGDDGVHRGEYDGDPVVIVREGLDDDLTLVYASPVEDDDAAVATAAALLAVSVPVVVLVVAVVTWGVVGRALRPVRRIRTEVDAISADRLDRRVEVPRSGDEIAALAGTMNGMLERLDAAARAQRRFVSDASHELRSPLATIRQHAELARSHPDATSADDLAAVVHDEGLRMQGLVDALLLLARLDEHAPSARASVDLDDLALAEASRLRTGGIEVDTRAVGAARVEGDPRLLAQLVRNLADNAQRHARSRVTLSVSERDGGAVFVVDDDGAGIPEEHRERIFDRFVRLDEARARDAGGSGLGLAIVRAIAAAAGGTVTATDAPGGGARFVVRLPATT
jgi:signal transduction histidine kinase